MITINFLYLTDSGQDSNPHDGVELSYVYGILM